jgi:hypothetical protein
MRQFFLRIRSEQLQGRQHTLMISNFIYKEQYCSFLVKSVTRELEYIHSLFCQRCARLARFENDRTMPFIIPWRSWSNPISNGIEAQHSGTSLFCFLPFTAPWQMLKRSGSDGYIGYLCLSPFMYLVIFCTAYLFMLSISNILYAHRYIGSSPHCRIFISCLNQIKSI